MNTYMIVIHGEGPGDEGAHGSEVTAAQALVASLEQAGHTIKDGLVRIDKGGEVHLSTAPKVDPAA